MELIDALVYQRLSVLLSADGYDMMMTMTILMCAQKLTDASLIYRTVPKTTRSPAVAERPRERAVS